MSTRLSTAELSALLADDPTTRVIDVRTGGEFETVHIPGSYNVPLDDLDEHGPTIAAIDEPVVLVCQSGGRATKAELTLGELGMDNLHVLDGGIAAWEAGGGAVRRGGDQRWALERQIRLVAGGIVAASVAGSLFVPQLKWVAGAIGVGLTGAALTDTCAMGMLLAKLPYNRSNNCDTELMVDRLRSGAPAPALA